MSLSPAFLDEIRARTSLSALIGRTVKIAKAGREFKGCCPFHGEKTASFYVNDDKGFYHCFSCSAHGDAIRWMTDQQGLGFIDAVKELAAAAGMEMPARSPEHSARAARVDGLRPALEAAQRAFVLALEPNGKIREYLASRDVGPDLIETFGIGYAPRGGCLSGLGILPRDGLEAGLLAEGDDGKLREKFRDRVMVPIHDERGRIVSFGGRVAPGNPSDAKYMNGPETVVFDKGRVVFNYHRASLVARNPEHRERGRLIITEGYMDVIALSGAGHAKAVAPMGTAMTEAQISKAWRLDPCPVLLLDGDKAGRAATLRTCHRILAHPDFGGASGHSVAVACLGDGLDPDDAIRAERAAGRDPLALIDGMIADAVPVSDYIFNAEMEGESTA